MRISDWSSDVCSSDLIAAPLGLSVEEAAYGILRIANSNMARAVRAVSTERGYDIRKFALCAFGGAGGLHAAELARDCGIATLPIPQEPGTMFAPGQIGKAPCTERGSQSGEIWGGHQSFK